MKIYVSKESKKEDTKETAQAFLIVSIAGFILLGLFAAGVLPIQVAGYMKVLMCIVLGAMLVIFFIIGITSLRQVKSLESQADKENHLETEIHDWFVATWKERILELAKDEDLSEEDRYFRRYEAMSAAITQKYPDVNELFLDHMVELLYAEIFE